MREVFDDLCNSRASELADLEIAIIHCERKYIKTDKATIPHFFDDVEDSERPEKTTLKKMLANVEPAKAAEKLVEDMMLVVKGKKSDDKLHPLARNILTKTTYDWKATQSRSRAREFIVIAKSSLIAAYHQKIMTKRYINKTSAGHLRQRLSAALAKNTDAVFENGASVYKWDFVDELVVTDVSKVPTATTGSLNQNMELVQNKRLPKIQSNEIKKILAAIVSSPLARFDRDDDGVLEKGVQLQMFNLMAVSNATI